MEYRLGDRRKLDNESGDRSRLDLMDGGSGQKRMARVSGLVGMSLNTSEQVRGSPVTHSARVSVCPQNMLQSFPQLENGSETRQNVKRLRVLAIAKHLHHSIAQDSLV